MQTFADPAQLEFADYPQLYANVREAVAERFSGEPQSYVNMVARQVAHLLQDLVRRRRKVRLRLTRLDRDELLLSAGDPPRCWICGWAFPAVEVQRFVGVSHDGSDPPLPLYVDAALPRGRVASDLQVNADHIIPISAGGGHVSNLRLACGWCNRAKAAALNTYDGRTRAQTYNHPRLGAITVPHPLWVVRALATVGKCEAPEGCDTTTRTDQLTVAPRWLNGALTPANIAVTCHDHDRWTAVRWVPRSTGR